MVKITLTICVQIIESQNRGGGMAKETPLAVSDFPTKRTATFLRVHCMLMLIMMMRISRSRLVIASFSQHISFWNHSSPERIC